MSKALSPDRRDWLQMLAQQVLIVMLITGSVSAGLVTVYQQRWGPTLLYSFLITLCCSLCIQGLRYGASWLLSRNGERCVDGWPGWPLMLVCLVLGTALGFNLGTELGNWITGYQEPGLHNRSLRRAMVVLTVSLLPGFGLTLYFLARSRIAAAEAKAQSLQRQAAEAQLRLLASQLEPHMLFNTLANLRVLIGLDPARAQAMLDRLIAFLRATLQASRSDAQPLREEFARLADYLALMQVRMDARLHTELSLPPELAELPVPPLLLQPLVENAVKHGLEPHVRGGTLRVSAVLEGEQLLLQVRDNGAGLGTVCNSQASGSGFGLEQVRSRLQTQYGTAASFNLESIPEPEGGTLASIRLPCRKPQP